MNKAMRRSLYILGAICLAAAATSCFGDKDSIATMTLDSVQKVEGIPSAESTVYLGDHLQFSPEVTFSEGSSPDDYTYRWMLAKDTIGWEKELDWTISLPEGYKYGESVRGVLIIHNNKTDLDFRSTFNIKIQNNLTPTWLAVYETAEGTIEWMVLQGAPENFTNMYPGMNKLVNGDSDPIRGNFRGAMVATDEFMIFTDEAPGFGRSISLIADPEKLPQGIGEKTGDIDGRVYVGSEQELDFRNIRFCEGGTRFLIMNDNLYAFDGMTKRLPVFDEGTFLKAQDVNSVWSSRQFVRIKKAVVVHYNDGTLGVFHAYNLGESPLYAQDGSRLKLDKVLGMFAESTSLGGNRPYNIYIIGQSGQSTAIYEYYINNISTTFQPPIWKKTIPVPQATAAMATNWWGALSQKYGFFSTRNAIYKYDYLNMTSFEPEPTPFKSYPSNYEIVGVFPLPVGSGLNNNEYGTMVYLYDAQKNTTTMQFYHTASGELRGEYLDAIPGRGIDFLKR